MNAAESRKNRSTVPTGSGCCSMATESGETSVKPVTIHHPSIVGCSWMEDPCCCRRTSSTDFVDVVTRLLFSAPIVFYVKQ